MIEHANLQKRWRATASCENLKYLLLYLNDLSLGAYVIAWYNEFAETTPHETPPLHKWSRWLGVVWYVIRMTYCFNINSSGWVMVTYYAIRMA